MVNGAFMHCLWTHKLHFSATFFIKNESHDTIHTFKNYFATMFSVSVFSFSTNKLNPNGPLVDHPNYAIKNYIDTLNDYLVSVSIVCKFGNTNFQKPYSLIL